jgi:predicted SprT family Zn-dependent metalloprotease
LLEHILGYGIPKEVIDLEYVKTLAKITRKDRIYIICPCGKRQFLKICYVTRTIKKTGSYHCKLCAIKIYQDKKLVKEGRDNL